MNLAQNAQANTINITQEQNKRFARIHSGLMIAQSHGKSRQMAGILPNSRIWDLN
jgi:hypothetical protein